MRRWPWLAVLSVLAFALSLAYVAHYLRGGPRIIDATSYFLEARSLAAGSFRFWVPEPSGSFRGRFLLASDAGHQLGVIFPPGYPLLLALGVRLGLPLLLGPLLGAALVLATYFLARGLGESPSVALLGAALSALCAALRYHTADTMSHGLATLLLCLALGLALWHKRRSAPLLCGLCLGLLVATRPVSALVAAVLCAFALRKAGPRAWLGVLAGGVPGVCLLLAQQHALTGHYLGSAQLAYYAMADAPPHCYRYGFGAGVGCHFEHGDYVTRFLPNGYGWRPALRNLLVHLALFGTDATNALPLTLLAGYAAIRRARSALSLLTLGIGLQALAYTPFYFDGNYPGGGARFLCEAIPLCQILVARAALDLGLGRLVIPAALAGFVFYARLGHEQLRDREGGRPMFEPEVLARAHVSRGLVFVDTDHGFNLGHDPRVTSPTAGVLVARARGDAHDRLLYERLGRPPTYHYVYDAHGFTPPQLAPYTPPDRRRLEAEAEWPALLARGSAHPVYFPCASRGAGLRLFPGTDLILPVPHGAASLELGWFSTSRGESELWLSRSGGPRVRLSAVGPGCSSWLIAGPTPDADAPLELSLVRGEGALDFIAPAPAGAGAAPDRAPASAGSLPDRAPITR